jgi:O-methyltransferase
MDAATTSRSRWWQLLQRTKNRVSYPASIFAATISFYSLYYRNLIGYYLQNVSLSRPGSFSNSFRMMRLVYRVRGYTAVFVPRLVALYKLSEEINQRSLPGDIVECGVYNGGSAAIMASLYQKSPVSRNVWLFDSFEGLPKPTDKDGDEAPEYEGWCHGDLSKVEEVLRKLHIPESRVRIVKGWFQDTFPKVEIPKIAILHIDADWYESVKLCLEKFYDSVQPGGYVVLDDYGDWQGCRIATDEFLKKRTLDVKLIQVDYTGFYFQKPPNNM